MRKYGMSVACNRGDIVYYHGGLQSSKAKLQQIRCYKIHRKKVPKSSQIGKNTLKRAKILKKRLT